jgi:hypothetical protein
MPSMHGYGFSGKPQSTGWNPDHIARAWAVLMGRSAALRRVTRAMLGRSGISTASLRTSGLSGTTLAAGPLCTRRTTRPQGRKKESGSKSLRSPFFCSDGTMRLSSVA